MRLPDLLRNISGEPEIGRAALALGVAFAVVTPVAFEIYEIGWNGGHFDVTAWCLAYPGGLAALVTTGVVAIGNKEKQVADARQTIAAAPLDDKSGTTA